MPFDNGKPPCGNKRNTFIAIEQEGDPKPVDIRQEMGALIRPGGGPKPSQSPGQRRSKHFMRQRYRMQSWFRVKEIPSLGPCCQVHFIR